MESVKSAISRGVQARHGECVVQMDGLDLCMKVRIRAHEDYIIYVRPNDGETRFLCHYARYDDVVGRKCFYHVMLEELGEEWLKHVQERNARIDHRHADASKHRIQCRCEPAEVQAWKQSRAHRLVRVFNAPLSKFAAVALQYVDAAVERIRTIGGVEAPRVMTFAEAKLEAELYPRPLRPPPTLPPPVCRRHGNLYRAAGVKRDDKGTGGDGARKKQKTTTAAPPSSRSMGQKGEGTRSSKSTSTTAAKMMKKPPRY